MIELLKGWLKGPLRAYEFGLFAPSDGKRDRITVEARTELDARRAVREIVNTGYWLVGPAERKARK